MEKRKGICTNYDGCSKADNNEIQEVDSLEDFVCEECKHDLEEYRPPKKKGLDPKMMIIIGAVALVAIIVGLVFALSGSDNEALPNPEIEEVVVDSIATEEPEVIPNRADTLVIKVEGEDKLQQSEDTVPAPTVAQTTTATAPTVTEKPKTSQSPKPTTTTNSGSTTHRLSYGTWTGGWRNGKPHGMGTMTYSTSHTIDSRDSKGRTAQPGEYVVGEWDNGNLVQGRWFKKDGSKEAIIIGKAG